MKTLGVGVVLCLSVSIGVIPSCEPKNGRNAQNNRPAPRILLTLQRQAGTTTAPNDQTTVTIDSGQGPKNVPLKDESTIVDIVRKTYAVHKDNTVAVIKANSDARCQLVTKLVKIAARGRVNHFRFETDRATTTFSLAPDLEHISAEAHRDANALHMLRTVYFLRITDPRGIYELTGYHAKISDIQELTEALAKLRRRYGRDQPKVVIVQSPDATWRNLVVACKAARDAGIEYPILAEKGRDHPHIPEEYKPAHKAPKEETESPANTPAEI